MALAAVALLIGVIVAGQRTSSSSSSSSSSSPAQDPCTAYLGAAAMPPEQQQLLDPYLATLNATLPLANGAAYPFCFVYGGVASSALLPKWAFGAIPPQPYADATRRTLYSWIWTEPAPPTLSSSSSGGSSSRQAGSSRMVVELNVTLLDNHPSAADAVLSIRNTGTAPTAAVTRPSSFSVAFAANDAENDPARLYTRVGGNGSPSDFYPASAAGGNPMVPGKPDNLVLGGIISSNSNGHKEGNNCTAGCFDGNGRPHPAVLQNQCGTGSYGTLPFFQVEHSNRRRGMLFSLGWSGQWIATVNRTSTAVTVAIGLGGQHCAVGGFPADGAGRGANDDYPNFAVVPGESLRLLRVLSVGYSSAVDSDLHQRGLNIHRRIILDAIAPRAYQTPGTWPWAVPPPPRTAATVASAGPPPIYPLIAAIANQGNKPWKPANQSGNMALLDAARSVKGVEEIWIDVGWNAGGCFGGNYAQPVIDSVDRSMWPSGSLQPVFGAAHEHNINTVLWFMPEMNVNSSCECIPAFGKQCAAGCPTGGEYPGSYLYANFPEWLAQDDDAKPVPLPGPTVTSLIDLGVDAARDWMAAYVSDAIDAWDIDTFRIESSCNGGHDCLSYFQSHDNSRQARLHPGVPRAGITEISHTAGLHTLFATLRSRHPGLVVDVCAGGGRKVDLDIMQHAIQKWQSDYTPPPGTFTGAAHDNVQGHLMGEQHYQPLSAGGISSSEPYAWRSVATTGGLIFWDQTNDTEEMKKRTAQAIEETHRLRPIILGGDFYHLTGLDEYGWSNMSASPGMWAGWQWANATGHNGAVLLFRRSEAADAVQVSLNAAIPTAQYQLSFSFNYSVSEVRHCSGTELRHLTARMPSTVAAGQASVLIEYIRVDVRENPENKKK